MNHVVYYNNWNGSKWKHSPWIFQRIMGHANERGNKPINKKHERTDREKVIDPPAHQETTTKKRDVCVGVFLETKRWGIWSRSVRSGFQHRSMFWDWDLPEQRPIKTCTTVRPNLPPPAKNLRLQEKAVWQNKAGTAHQSESDDLPMYVTS